MKKVIKAFVCTAAVIFLVAYGTLCVSAQIIADYEFEEDTAKQIIDVSGKNNHGAFNDADEAGLEKIEGKFGKAAWFDGANQFFDVPESVFNIDAMTLAFWVKWEGGAAWQRFFELGSGKTGEHWMMVPYTSEKKFQFSAYDKSTEKAFVANPSDGKWEFPKNEWVHIAQTVDKNNLVKLYINGQLLKLTVKITEGKNEQLLRGVTEFTSPVSVKYSNNPTEAKGQWVFRRFASSATSTWDAKTAAAYDSIKIYDEALSAEQINNLMKYNKLDAGTASSSKNTTTAKPSPDTTSKPAQTSKPNAGNSSSASTGTSSTSKNGDTTTKPDNNSETSSESVPDPSGTTDTPAGTTGGESQSSSGDTVTDATEASDTPDAAAENSTSASEDTPTGTPEESDSTVAAADTETTNTESTASTDTATTQNESAPQAETTEDNGLSSGTIAGIVIGAIVVVGGALLFVFRKRIFKS